MNQFRGPALISTVVLLAFLWGYKKDALHGTFTSRSPEPAPVEEAKPLHAPVAAPAVAKQLSIPAAAKPYAPPQMAKPVQPTQGQKPFTPPANPYANLASKYGKKHTSMAETFEAIRRNSVDQKQVIQKNAYFRKLSEQLKQLRGEDQPGATAAPNNTTAAKPMPKRTIPPRPNSSKQQGLAAAGMTSNDSLSQMDLGEDDDLGMDVTEEEALAEELDQLLEAAGEDGMALE